jgi:hypothetical protein
MCKLNVYKIDFYEKKKLGIRNLCGYAIYADTYDYDQLKSMGDNANGPILHKGHIFIVTEIHYRERKLHCEVPNSNNQYVEAIGSQEPHLGV